MNFNKVFCKDLQETRSCVFPARRSQLSKTLTVPRYWFNLIAARQCDFIVPHVWEMVVRKNLTIFGGCHFARFYILIWWSFSKIETKNFNSDLCFFKLVKLGMISPAAHFLNCVHIGRCQTITATIHGLSSGKRFVKLKEVFWDF